MSPLKKLEQYKNRLASVREEAKEATEKTLGLVSGVAAAGGMGFINARYGDSDGVFKIMGTEIPLDVVLGAACAAASITGTAGKYDGLAQSVGQSVLSVAAARYAATFA